MDYSLRSARIFFRADMTAEEEEDEQKRKEGEAGAAADGARLVVKPAVKVVHLPLPTRADHLLPLPMVSLISWVFCLVMDADQAKEVCVCVCVRACVCMCQ